MTVSEDSKALFLQNRRMKTKASKQDLFRIIIIRRLLTIFR